MIMMACTAHLQDRRLKIGLPKSAFEHAIDDFKNHSDAKLWIPYPAVIEVRNIVVELRIIQKVEI